MKELMVSVTNAANEGIITNDSNYDEFDDYKYLTQGEFAFYECIKDAKTGLCDFSEKGSLVAVLRFTAFKETEICNDRMSVFDMADAISGDLATCVACLKDKKIEDIKCSEDDSFRDTAIVVIDRLYVKEAYRNQGIATMILKNLNALLGIHFNLCPRLWLISVEPDKAEIKDAKEHPVYDIMVSLIEHCGFVPTDDNRVYGFNVSLHEPFSGEVSVKNLSEEAN